MVKVNKTKSYYNFLGHLFLNDDVVVSYTSFEPLLLQSSWDHLSPGNNWDKTIWLDTRLESTYGDKNRCGCADPNKVVVVCRGRVSA